MNITKANKFLAFALAPSLSLILAGHATAQTFTTLYSFTDGSDGSNPWAGLVLSGNTLYGTAREGGSSGFGTVFALNTDGTGFTNLYSFTAPSYNGNNENNSDGARPLGGLVLSGNTLYGAASMGGSGGTGTVFAINTDASDFAVLYDFTDLDSGNNSDGCLPQAQLLLSGNTLYGTASEGGSSDRGTVFSVNTDGSGFTTLHSFTTVFDTPNSANSDGDAPIAGLVLSGDTLYGTAILGGSSGNGTVFAINTDGTGFTTLYSFSAGSGFFPGITNSDGAYPYAGLVLSSNTLYGTALTGGSSGSGTVFSINTNGTGFTTLYNFTDGGDGANPYAGLILSGNTLYGTALNGGTSSNGTVFAINTDGTGFTTLYCFTAPSGPYPATNSDGASPYAGLILSRNVLYGTTELGGSAGFGTVFSLTLPPVSAPQLAITLSGTNVVLTWPSTATGFNLQSTPNPGSPAVWTAVSPGAVIIDGQNTVTNPISATQQFYQLIH